MKRLLLTSYLLILTSFLNAQTSTIYAIEYDSIADLNFLVSVNPNDGAITQIDTLEGAARYSIANITYNSNSDFYVVTGNDGRIYTIDANTGAILNNPVLSASITEIQYDKINDKYYAIENEVTTTTVSTGMSSTTITTIKLYFVSVNNITGSITRLDSIPGIESVQIGSSIFNPNTDEYTFIAEKDKIYTIDASNGDVISNPTLSTEIVELQYDIKNNNYYALEVVGNTSNTGTSSTNSTANDNNSATIYLVGVNTTTGVVTRVDSVSGLNSVRVNTSAIDTVNNYFEVINENDELLSIDLSNASIVNQPQLNAFILNTAIKSTTGGGSRVIEENPIIKKVTEINTYPNPASSFINIEVDQIPAQLEVYNRNGQKVMQYVLMNNTSQINIGDLKKGFYVFKVNNTNGQVSERIIVQ